MDPRAHGELGDENVSALGEQDGRLSGDHLDFRVCLHHLLDARQWQLVELVVMLVRLELRHLLLPVCVEDVAVVALQALIDILPRAGKQLWVGRMALGGNGCGCAIVASLLRVVERIAGLPVISTRRSGGGAHLLEVLVHVGFVAQRLRGRKVGGRVSSLIRQQVGYKGLLATGIVRFARRSRVCGCRCRRVGDWSCDGAGGFVRETVWQLRG